MDSVRDILEATQYGVLATVSTGDTPHGVPVQFVYDNDSLYFRSSPDTDHSRNIKNNPNVSFTIFDTTQSVKGAVYIQSRAKKLDDEDERRAIELFGQQFDHSPAQWGETYYFQVYLGDIDQEKSIQRMYYFRSLRHES